MSAKLDISDFTEQSYCAALDLAKQHWRFESFETNCAEPHALWRHDVDVSPHRAIRLAQLENERAVKATYFFLLHSAFYSCLEAATRELMRKTAGYGHEIGLHFDASFYDDIVDYASLERRIAQEADIIADLAGKRPVAVSFHDPTTEQLANFGQDRLAGLVNAYGMNIRKAYRYVSDSNGYWRFHRLHDVLAEGKEHAIHVLTHPEWWTPEASSPRERIRRAIEGRATGCLRTYDIRLAALGRTNVH